jgi:hypothetical protein
MNFHKYALLKAPSSGELASLVNEAIGKGWEPQGGVAVAIGVSATIGVGQQTRSWEIWSQAVVDVSE